MGSQGWTVLGVPVDSVAAPAGGPPFGTELSPAVLRDLGLVGRLAGTDAGDLDVRITGPDRDAVSGIVGWPSVGSVVGAIRAAVVMGVALIIAVEAVLGDQRFDDALYFPRRAGVRELEHIAFRNQPVSEIDSLDGKAVPARIDEVCPFGMDEARRCAGAGAACADERNGNRQGAPLADATRHLCGTDAQQPYPFNRQALRDPAPCRSRACP